MTARPLADMTDADLRKLARHGPKVADSLIAGDPKTHDNPAERVSGFLYGHALAGHARRELRARKAEAYAENLHKRGQAGA